MFTASVTRLRRIPGIHRLDGNPLLGGFVANLCVELGKTPSVQPSIHVLAVVHVLADVRQVFQHQHWILDRLSVLNDVAGHTAEHVIDLIPQRLAIGLHDSLTATLLKASCGGEVGFAEPTNGLAVVGPQSGANRRTRVVTVTHRDEARFSDVHANRRPVEPSETGLARLVRRRPLVGGRVRFVLHVAGRGDVEIPRSLALEQPTFTHLGVVCVHRFEPLPLVGIGACRYPEVVILVVGDFDVPLDGVLWLVIEPNALVGEPHRVVVVKLVGIVAVPTELWDVLLEGVFRVAAQVVLNNHVVGRCLCVTASGEGGLQCLLVGVPRLTKLLSLVDIRVHKLQFERFREFSHRWRTPLYDYVG